MSELTDQLGALLETLGLAASAAWPHVVRAYWVQSLATLILAGIAFVVAAVVLPRFFQSVEAYTKASYDDQDMHFVRAAAFGAAGALLCLGGFLGVSHNVYRVIDPAGGLILDLLTTK